MLIKCNQTIMIAHWNYQWELPHLYQDFGIYCLWKYIWDDYFNNQPFLPLKGCVFRYVLQPSVEIIIPSELAMQLDLFVSVSKPAEWLGTIINIQTTGWLEKFLVSLVRFILDLIAQSLWNDCPKIIPTSKQKSHLCYYVDTETLVVQHFF